jgi:hypothetical protein
MRLPSKTAWIATAGVIAGIMWACPCHGQYSLNRRPTGRVSPYTGGQEYHRFTASDATSYQFFGASVAIESDTAAVGAVQTDVDGTPNAGAVYIFRRTAGTWSETQVITKPESESSTSYYFGRSVALSGNHLLVGVPNHAIDDQYDVGAVYAYRWDGSEFQFHQEIMMEALREGAWFGVSLAADGTTLVVGARNAGSSNEGTTYVYQDTGDEWTLIQELSPDDWIPDNHFGVAVALSGDWLVIGANADTNGSMAFAGSAYVYRHDGSSWIEEQKLVANDADNGDSFGISVALSSRTLAIGAMNKDHPDQQNAGSVYIYNESGGHWTEQAEFFSQNPTEGTGWGQALAVIEDTALIGAPNADHPEFAAAGCVDVLTRNGDQWAFTQRQYSPEPNSTGYFGYAISHSGSDLIIGAVGEHAPEYAWYSGSAYIMQSPQRFAPVEKAVDCHHELTN